jgi:hypothetical protein
VNGLLTTPGEANNSMATEGKNAAFNPRAAGRPGRTGTRRRRPASARPTPRGVTLVEVLVVVAVTSAVFGVVVSLLVSLMRKDRDVRSFALRFERQGELAEALRVDIRGAREVSLSAQTVLDIVAPDEQQTRYELTAGGCRRISVRPEDAAPRIEFFAVGAAAAWALEPGPAGRRPLFKVTLHRSSAEGDSSPAPLPFLVYAVLGADVP